MNLKYIYTKGYLPNGCPTCDVASQPDEIEFDGRDLLDIMREAWQRRHEYKYSHIYDSEGKIICEIYYEYGRHCTTGMMCKVENGKWIIEDNGHGKKDFVFYNKE